VQDSPGAVTTAAHGPSAASGGEKTLKDTASRIFADEVRSRCPWKDKGTFEVCDVKVFMPPLETPADTGAWEATFSPREDFLGLVRGSLSFGKGPKALRVGLTCRTRLVARVPVAARNLRQGAVIGGADVDVAAVDITREPRVCMLPEDVLGKRTKVAVRRGAPVALSQVERRPEVCAGDAVIIRAKGENVEVEVRGVAVKDAHTGESVPVKNAASGRLVFGTVIAPSMVQVEL
jgi:flagella basal body P-ring formation protein FlgA